MNKIHQVYGWLNEDGSYYFVSKCLKGSEVPYQDKKHIKAPTDPTLIRILKEFEDEDESLDYLDACLYLMGFKSDGSGTLENSHDNIGSYRLKGRTSKPVTVYRVKDGSFVGDWSSVADACDSLRISRNSGYASLRQEHYAGDGQYHFLPIFTLISSTKSIWMR